MKVLRRKLFLKYMLVVLGLILGGIGIIVLFDDVFNGVIIDFIRMFAVNRDPFETFHNIYAILLPMVIGMAGFVLIYYLCKDLVKYMRILMDGIDDVMQKGRENIYFPKEMKSTQDLVLHIARDYQSYRKSAEEDEAKKKDLIFLLAQDIKLPLSNILMYMEFLDQEKRISPDIKKDYIVKVLEKSLNLEDMINEFFNITRFNLQYAKWNPEHMLLDRMMEQVVDEYYPFIEEKEMQVKLKSGSHLELYGDNEKIARAMRDLLRNLIELGTRNSILSIQILQLDSGYEIILEVPAFHLSAYQLAHIFHNYYRLEDMHGNGKSHVLGLGIAKQIMDMHQGSLRAASIGDVLSFYVIIPYRDTLELEDDDIQES